MKKKKEIIPLLPENFDLFASRIREIERELSDLLKAKKTDNHTTLKGKKATIFQEGRKEILRILNGIHSL